MAVEPRARLDQALVARGYFESRARARDAIKRGTVRVNGERVEKAALAVLPDAEIAVDDPAQPYVSRAALKLKAALETFSVPVAGRRALDLGASTGGFTEVLLEAGATHVTAVDVGHDQLHKRLCDDARITRLDRLNAKDLTAAHIGTPPDLITSDMSFISLMKALGPALALATSGADLIALVKPQFEVGPEGLGRGGIVRDDALAAEAVAGVRAWVDAQPGWSVQALAPSPITGGDGNRETLLWAQKA